MREFEILSTNDVKEPSRSLFPKLLFESWDLVLSVDPTRMAIWRTSPLSLPDTLVGCRRLYDFVPESSRHYLEKMQSMIKSKAALENTDLPLAPYWDLVLKRNRAKRLQLFARLLDIGLLRPRLKGAAKHFLGIFFVNNWEEERTPHPGCSCCELVIRVPSRRQSLFL